MAEDFDGIKEENNKPPLGWMIFYLSLAAWLVVYNIIYSPDIMGYSWNKIHEDEMKPLKEKLAQGKLESAKEKASGKIDAGKVMSAKCAMCHGADFKGQGTAPDLTAKKLANDELVTVITNGRNGMPPFKGQLSDDEIKAIAQQLSK